MITTVCRCLHRAALALIFVGLTFASGHSIYAQGIPISGNAPVTLTPSTTRVNQGSDFTADLKANLTGMTGTGSDGNLTAVVLGGYTISVSFDNSRFQFISAVGGTTPEYPTATLTYTTPSVANTSGSVTLSSTQSNANAPTGLVSLAVLTFKAIGSGSATFTPNPDSLASAIKFGAMIAGPARIPATAVAIQVTANTAPSANSQSVSGNEDNAIAITLTGTDPEGDSLTFSVATGPGHGTLTGTLPNLSYVPAPDYAGPDSFTFQANDGLLSSSAATVSITLNPVNDPPVAGGQSVTTSEDSSKAITLTATDVDSPSLSYQIVSSPVNGTLTGTPPNMTYTPNANFNGSDSFTFTASDGALFSNVATVSITITPVNDAPSATPQTVTTNEGTAVAVTLAGTDVDGDFLSFEKLSDPLHGVLSGSLPNLTFTPAAGFNGSDSFTFRVNDGQVNSSPATVSINVTAVVATVSALSPTSTCQAKGDFELTVSGTNFTPGTLVVWNGVSRSATTFDRSSQLRTNILQSEISSASVIPVRVSKPSAGLSNFINFTVSADSTPPAVTPPLDVIVPQSTCVVVAGPKTVAGVTSSTSAALAGFLAGGSATDGCSTATRLAPRLNGNDINSSSFFGRGRNDVTFRFQDGAGNVGVSSAAGVTVQVFGDLDLNPSATDPTQGVTASDLVVLSNYVVHNLDQGAPPFTAPLSMANLNGDTTGGQPVIDSLDLVILSNYVVGNILCLPLNP
ncbi:MAG: Ig-like domain-containing protein [Acidobacteriota bacterium]